MKGIELAQQCHIVNALPPVDINGAANSDVWSMKGFQKASIIIQMGVTGAASTVTVTKCDDFTPSNEVALAFRCYKEETAAGDTLGAKVAVAAAGFASSLNNGIFYVIEIDAAQLDDTYSCMRVKFSDPSAATFASCVVILSGGVQQDQSATAIV